ncbi:MAG: hypothetical protein DRP87_16115 [Spirochaetes bacterium]|nr:MAG: hypothetical protein DRP87_16115 [Spirochaetota bacterium]
MKDPEGYYYASRLINMIIGYNTSVSSPPKEWPDLLKPAYGGKLGFPSPLRYVWPEDGAVFIPSPIAIFKDSKNSEAAKVFIDYIISREGQKTMVELGDFIPVRTDVDPPAGTPSLGEIEKLPTDWKSVQRMRQDTKDRWTTLFGEE